MSGRDANQLAADVRRGFMQPEARIAARALDEIVALVADLEAVRDVHLETIGMQIKEIRAAEAQVAALTQERDMARAGRDQWQRDAEGRGVVMYELLARAEAAEAALAAVTSQEATEPLVDEAFRWKARADELGAALAEANQRITELEAR